MTLPTALGVASAVVAAAWMACTAAAIATHRYTARCLHAEIQAEFSRLRVPGCVPGTRGVVMCAGGSMYLAQAFASLRCLRETGCSLPVEIVHVGAEEVSPQDRAEFKARFGSSVRFLDASAARLGVAPTNLRGFEIKSYALLLTTFEHCILLDADCLPIDDPTPLFDEPAYTMHGCIFWPDYAVSTQLVRPWMLGVFCSGQVSRGFETESGQIVVHKPRCCEGLAYAWLLNKHADVFYKHYYGDKDLFRIGFIMARIPFYQVPHSAGIVGMASNTRDVVLCAMVQKWPRSGNPLFIHRTMHKRLSKHGVRPRWTVYVANDGLDQAHLHTIRWYKHHHGTCISGACDQAGPTSSKWTSICEQVEADEQAYELKRASKA